MRASLPLEATARRKVEHVLSQVWESRLAVVRRLDDDRRSSPTAPELEETALRLAGIAVHHEDERIGDAFPLGPVAPRIELDPSGLERWHQY